VRELTVDVLLYEKKIDSFPQLISDLGVLDQDAGIRAIGKYKAKKCFVFVTRSLNGFTSILCSMKRAGKESIPDKRLLAKEFENLQDLEKFLTEVVAKPLVAFGY
jgi:hypothetical protein